MSASGWCLPSQRRDGRAEVEWRFAVLLRRQQIDGRGKLLDEGAETAFGGTQFLSALRELRICSLAVGDVLKLADVIEGRTTLVPHDRRVDPYPDDRSILPQVALLHLQRGNLTGEQLLDLGEVPAAVIGMSNVLKAQGQQFGLGVAEQMTKGGIHTEKLTIKVDENNIHPKRRIFEGGAEALFTLPESLRRVLSGKPCGLLRARCSRSCSACLRAEMSRTMASTK